MVEVRVGFVFSRAGRLFQKDIWCFIGRGCLSYVSDVNITEV
jgi:hypothetical protein